MLKIKRPHKTLFSSLKATFGLWLAFVLLSLGFIIFTNHGFLNIFFSNHYSENVGLFFKYYTLLGEEWLLAPVCFLIFLTIKKIDFAVKVTFAFLLNALITLASKHLLFDAERPTKFLEKYNLILTQGVDVHQYNSFPSGHTSTAFAVAFILTFYFRNDKKGVIFIVLAMLVGLSRIYLQQHFAEDVIGGAFIGLISALAANYLTFEKNEPN